MSAAPRPEVIKDVVERLLAVLEEEAADNVTLSEMVSAAFTLTHRVIVATVKLVPEMRPILSEGLYPLITACTPQ